MITTCTIAYTAYKVLPESGIGVIMARKWSKRALQIMEAQAEQWEENRRLLTRVPCQMKFFESPFKLYPRIGSTIYAIASLPLLYYAWVSNANSKSITMLVVIEIWLILILLLFSATFYYILPQTPSIQRIITGIQNWRAWKFWRKNYQSSEWFIGLSADDKRLVRRRMQLKLFKLRSMQRDEQRLRDEKKKYESRESIKQMHDTINMLRKLGEAQQTEKTNQELRIETADDLLRWLDDPDTKYTHPAKRTKRERELFTDDDWQNFLLPAIQTKNYHVTHHVTMRSL